MPNAKEEVSCAYLANKMIQKWGEEAPFWAAHYACSCSINEYGRKIWLRVAENCKEILKGESK